MIKHYDMTEEGLKKWCDDVIEVYNSTLKELKECFAKKGGTNND